MKSKIKLITAEAEAKASSLHLAELGNTYFSSVTIRVELSLTRNYDKFVSQPFYCVAWCLVLNTSVIGMIFFIYISFLFSPNPF